jgi:hypothetical protein
MFWDVILSDCQFYNNEYLDSKEIKMNSKLILGLALAVVLVSGGLFSAQANCDPNPCGLHLPSYLSSSARAIDTRDADLANNALNVGPNMGNGSPGYPWFSGK